MNKVVHFEIPTKNLEKSKKFYSKIFDWKFIPIPEMNYTMIHTAKTDEQGMIKEIGAINGGMTKDDPVKNPVLVVSVKDINEAIVRIKEAGGKMIMDKVKVGDMGLYARFKDPEGKVLGIWQDIKH